VNGSADLLRLATPIAEEQKKDDGQANYGEGDDHNGYHGPGRLPGRFMTLPVALASASGVGFGAMAWRRAC